MAFFKYTDLCQKNGFFKSYKYLTNIFWIVDVWFFEKAFLLWVKKRGLFVFFVFCFVVSLLLAAFNLEKKAFYYILTAFWRPPYQNAYENQVYIPQIVRKNVTGISNIFQHGEGMVVFKPHFFMMTFQDFRDIWWWLTLFLLIFIPKFLYDS